MTKRVIYKPVVDELIPTDAVILTYQIAGIVIDALVDDDFVTAGTVLYDSTPVLTFNEQTGEFSTHPFVAFAEQPKHQWAGWFINSAGGA